MRGLFPGRTGPIREAMVWFFERSGSRLHFELRHATEGRSYELVLTHPDGTQLVERFDEPRGLARRSCVLRTELVNDGWQVIGDA